MNLSHAWFYFQGLRPELPSGCPSGFVSGCCTQARGSPWQHVPGRWCHRLQSWACCCLQGIWKRACGLLPMRLRDPETTSQRDHTNWTKWCNCASWQGHCLVMCWALRHRGSGCFVRNWVCSIEAITSKSWCCLGRELVSLTVQSKSNQSDSCHLSRVLSPRDVWGVEKKEVRTQCALQSATYLCVGYSCLKS